jgi:hypothetical protein
VTAHLRADREAAVVAVDPKELRDKLVPAKSPLGQPEAESVAEFRSRIEQLEVELAAEQQRSAGHQADYERERERADQLVISQDKLVIQVKNLRLLLQAVRQDSQPFTFGALREWWRWRCRGFNPQRHSTLMKRLR